MPKPSTAAADAPVALSPSRRVLRTVAQVVLALAGAIPAAIALLPIPASVAAWAVGIAGATVILVTALQNALEAITGKTLAAPKG